ncbi:sensor domain-containing diguanylate cyclase [Thalassospira alkalitolerans]|uniref:Diguanylate cyclase n=1 Tax=Thalassospira alkalitolerans TaxID=1293890 RepID=A0A1Y2LCU0_9PROT|nr:sensor domain-containing diguanylate cyclase [Thalassospira alkalitolerans]OSQ48453.1 diguanylate cyclase [Thalassospira alkalitolerans]|tara:strand:+ start:205911 stop:207635 length:1725 start_codon:yes stop_codon:yes gene_type:complete
MNRDDKDADNDMPEQIENASSQGFTLDPKVMADAEAPVLVMDAQGTPLFANKNAMSFANGIREGLFPEINKLVMRAITTPGGVVELLTFEVQRGTAALELTALPMADNRVLLLPRDVSMDRNLRDALIDSRQRYRDIVEVSSAFAWETDETGNFVFVSPRGALGFKAENLVGRSPLEFLLDTADQDSEIVFRSQKAVRDVPIWLRRANGSAACLAVSSTPVYTRDGRWTGTRGLAHDITEQRRRESEIATARNRDRLMTYIVRTMRDEIDPTLVLKGAADASARALACAGCAIFRRSDTSDEIEIVACHGPDDLDPIAKQALKKLGKTDDTFEAEIDEYRVLAQRCHYHQRANGAVVFIFNADHPAPNEGERAIMTEVSDQIGIAIEQAAQHDRIVTLSRTDGLTGLLNRRAFFDELTRRHARLLHEDMPASLMYVDMDNFKLVNDVHGHQTGDEAILALTQILLENTRPIDLVARLGGDEFVIWLDGADMATASQRARILLDKSAALSSFSGAKDQPLGISVGIAIREPDSKEPLEQLVLRADQTMYQVKKHGKGSFGIAAPPGSDDPAKIED